jgi:hypothetical protein
MMSGMKHMKHTTKRRPLWQVLALAFSAAGRWVCTELEEGIRARRPGAFKVEVVATGLGAAERKLAALQHRAESLAETCERLEKSANRAARQVERAASLQVDDNVTQPPGDPGGFMPWEKGGGSH